MTAPREEEVYEKERRRRGSVLIIGAGAGGGHLAVILARLGISPLHLVDKDKLTKANLHRHPLGEQDVGQPKAPSLARKIRTEFSLCNAFGEYTDFLRLDDAQQVALLRKARLVIAATDSPDCQQRINELCVRERIPALYAGIWAGDNTREGEVAMLLHVIPGEGTPCYRCYTISFPPATDTESRGGSGADVQWFALVTAWAAVGLFDPDDPHAIPFDRRRTLTLIHSVSRISPSVRWLFRGRTISNFPIVFPRVRCPVCGGQDRTQPPIPAPRPQPPVRPSLDKRWLYAALGLLLLVVGIVALAHHHGAPAQASPGDQQPAVGPAQSQALGSAAPSSGSSSASALAAPPPSSLPVGWSSGQQVDTADSYLTAVSCPTTSFCAAVDNAGYAYTFSNNAWSKGEQLDTSGSELLSVSCSSASFCAAATAGPTVYMYSNGTWSSSSVNGAQLVAVSCPTDGDCVAVDNNNAYIYSNGSWDSGTPIEQQNNLTSISCPTTSYCMAVDKGGNVYAYSDGNWSSGQQVDSSGDGLSVVSCSSSSFCAAIGPGSNAYVDSGGNWSTSDPLIAADGATANLNTVSCPTDGYCVAMGNLDSYTYAHSAWSHGHVIQQQFAFEAVSCASQDFCMAVDNAGNAYSYSAG